MAGAATGMYIRGLNASGFFARGEVRSLVGHMGYYGSSGGASGLAYAEANALIKKQEMLPTAEEALNDFISGVAGGIAFGGLAYTGNRFIPRQVTNIDAGDSQLRVISSRSGEALKAELQAKVSSQEWHTTNFRAVKLTDGSWGESNHLSVINTAFRNRMPNEAISDVLNTPAGPKLTFQQFVQNGNYTDSVGTVSRTFSPGENNTQFWAELRHRSAFQQMLPGLRRILAIGLLGSL